MRIKLDENLGNRDVGILRNAGHGITTVVEEGLASASDGQLIEVCRSENRRLVSLDLDLSNPLQFDLSRYASIAVLRLPERSKDNDLFDSVRTLTAGLSASSVEGKLWTKQRGRIREYQQEQQDE